MSKEEVKNFKLYNASAGSGKTFTLIKEFFALSLSSDKIAYKDILAVTFTNKAANELKDKILNYLDGIINEKTDADDMKEALVDVIDEKVLKERAAKLYENILHNYSDLNISTIDGFVQQIARTFARELNLPNQYRVMIDDDDLLDELIQRIDDKINKNDNKFLTDILAEFIKYQIKEENSWHLDSPIKNFIKKLFKENAYRKGERLSIKLLDENEYAEVKQYLDDKIKDFKKFFVPIDELKSKYRINEEDYYYKALPSLVTKIKEEENIDKILTSRPLKILNGESNWYASKIDISKLDKLSNDNVDVVQRHVDLIDAYRSYYIIKIIRDNLYLYALRGRLMDVINQYIEETNKVHISEFNKRLSDIIGDCSIPFIYERIGTKFKHFFIDEFQDTSFLQWFNFLPLVNNSLSEKKMCLLVGDAKQAIYRFRSGEVEQIIKLPVIHRDPKTVATKEYQDKLNDEIIHNFLNVNYRSKQNIVQFNNSFFRKSKSQLRNVDYRNVYENRMEQEYDKNKSYKGYVNIEIFDNDKLVDIEHADTEIAKPKTAKVLYKEAVKKSMLNNIKILVEKGYKLSDITILVRSNSDGTDIAGYLTNNNIRVISSDSIMLKSSDKVQLIIYSLKYLMNENNRLLQLSLAYFQGLCKRNESDTDSINKIHLELENNNLLQLRNEAYSLYDLCIKIIKLYGLNVIDDVFIHYFMNLVYDWQNTEGSDINSFLEHWDRKLDTFCIKAASKENAVQIMTIHKSKGLAFKVVMYPYAYTKVPSRFKGGERWLSFKDDFKELIDIPYIEEFLLPINGDIQGTKLNDYYGDEYDKAAFDDFNLMYVAMTRPKDALYIYTDNSSTKDDSSNFFVDYFNEKNNHYYAEFDNDDNEMSRNYFEFVKCDTEVSETYSLGEIVYDGKEDKTVAEEIYIDDDISYDELDWYKVLKFDHDPTMFWAHDDGESISQEWGILVHDILSKIDVIENAESVLDNYVNSGTIDKETSNELLKTIKEVFNLEKTKDAFSKDAVVKNEMDILTADGKVLRPDRYVELDDKVIVIDYKTGAYDEKYYTKQQEYMRVLKEMVGNKKIEGYILFVGENVYAKTVYLDRLF